jgi:hypothetical protein
LIWLLIEKHVPEKCEPKGCLHACVKDTGTWNIIFGSECGGSHSSIPVLVNNIIVLGKSLER